MRLLIFLILFFTPLVHSQEWMPFVTLTHEDPMTDEITVMISASTLFPPPPGKRMEVVGWCYPKHLAFSFNDGEDQPNDWGDVQIRLDKDDPFVLSGHGYWGGFKLNPSDTKIVLEALRTRQQIVFRVNDGMAVVVPLTGAAEAMHDFDKACPHLH